MTEFRLTTLIACIFFMGCNPNDEESKNYDKEEPIVSKPVKEINHPALAPSIFQQDINKSYSSIDRPWVLAKPTDQDVEFNASEFFDE